MSRKVLPSPRLLLSLLLLLATQAAWAQSPRSEAESGSFVGRFNNDPAISFSGSGFVDDLTISHTSLVRFQVTVSAAGNYNVSLRYATALSSTRYLRIYVNGASAALATLAPTGGWGQWRNNSQVLFLPAGQYDLEYRVEDTNAGFGWVNLDYLWFSREVGNGPLSQPIVAGDQLIIAKLAQLPVPASSLTNMNGKAIINNLATSGERLFAVDAVQGIIHEVFDKNGRRGDNTPFFNLRNTLASNGHELYAYGPEPQGVPYNVSSDLFFGGVRGLAFHPDFASNGKFYTSQLEFQATTANPPNANNYIGPQYTTNSQTLYNGRQMQPVSTVIEWTCTTRNAQNEFSGTGASYREVCRISLPGLTRTATDPGRGFDHYIGEIHFGPDGKLYIAHGDCSEQYGGGLDNDALGKVLRIDPTPTGNRGYTVPIDNPGLPNVPAEVYARGFRNPHTFDFWQHNGAWHLLLADVGRNNIEEINSVLGGKDYGWPYREGTFEHFRAMPFKHSHELVAPLPPVADGYEYPAAQWGHDYSVSGQAIAGGGLYDNTATGRTQYLFADLAGAGRFFYCNAADLLATTRNHAAGPLTQAQIKQYALLYDDNINDPTNALVQHATLNSLLGSGRSDIRFTKGSNGALYFSSKQTGCVYRIQNVEPGNLYEAELASWGGGVLAGGPGAVANKASHNGFLEYFTNPGAWVEFTVNVPAAGLYNAELRYANATPDRRTMSVLVDGTDVVQAAFPSTGSWENWRPQAVTLYLPAGQHTIRYQYNPDDSGWINADCIRLKRATYEAEDAQTNARIDLNVPAYRGTGYVDDLINPGRYVDFTVTVPSAAQYTVSVRYTAARGQTEKLGVVVNNTRVGQVSLPTTNYSWAAWTTATHTLGLAAGENHLRYEYDPNAGDTGWSNLDYIELQRTVAPCGNCQPNQRAAAAPSETSEVLAYPNPAASSVHLPTGTTHVELVNRWGQVVLSRDWAGTEFSVAELPEGLYQLRLLVADKYHSQHLEVRR